MAEIFRVFVEKKEGFDIEAQKMLAHISGYLGIESVRGLRIVNCYDVQGLNSKEFEICVKKVFSEANVDNVYFENLDADGFIFGKALLPGQYDQRADWAALCAQVLTGRLPLISFTKFHIVSGELSEADRASILKHAINPIDSMEVGLEKPKDLEKTAPIPADVASVDMNQDPAEIRKNMGLAMSQEDLAFLRDYFLNEEGRNPTVTEIKMIDTYWSDHCRHTTFHAALERIEFEDGPYKAIFEQTYSEYLAERAQIHADDRPVTLMDLATIGMKILRRDGHLDDLDVSEEVNAASIVIDVDFGDGESEEWLLMFKNETHNHPTEIEPFGGAATCLGGAIRDPLSGRAYVYQAMRVSGAGDPRATQEQTLPGKLPQRLITTQAAAGYSSYGNQIGLATGLVREIYHEDYRAKRMEIGAVIGAVKKEYVVREVPQKGDVVLLIGGRTGRDGIGGATGSSRAHEEKSLSSAGAEVQKGNPITQRKLQRLFRNPEAIRLIIRCNDFGAGGVSVAIGELADSIEINLDNVKKKYEGLDGTELAISESQERMAVVVRAKDVETLIRLAFNENLEAYQVAEITDTGRLVMTWRGKRIVDISREFLNSAGVQQKASVIVANPTVIPAQAGIPPTWLDNLRDLNVAGQKGLIEHFDSTVGAGTVLAPFGGKYQLTPTQAMAARIPVLGREAKTASLMSFGFNPYLSAQSPYHGAVYAVVESIARLVAAGVDYSKIRLSFQEYFEKLTDAKSWGKPFSAILGAFAAQMALKIPSIGGKDSMSGTYEGRYNVPPTLVSFSAAAAPIENIISPEFKRARNNIALIQTPLDENGLPNFEKLRKNFDLLHRLIADKVVISARAIGFGGLAAALSEMSFGNRIGVDVTYLGDFFSVGFGNFVVELGADSPEGLEVIGRTIAEPDLVINDERIAIEECIMAWLEPLEDVFPTGILGEAPVALDLGAPIEAKQIFAASKKFAKPRVLLPVFPGTNCEWDMAAAFEKAGAAPEIFVLNNLNHKSFTESVAEMARRINNAQIIALPGGFSAGDEPDGSGKFIAAVFANPSIAEATMELLNAREGLIIGICNGFQALVKMGLLPYGKIAPLTKDSPTLTYNAIGRHISNIALTKVMSNKSPWLAGLEPGEIFRSAASHGQGRFMASDALTAELFANGQVTTVFVDHDGNPTEALPYNPNGAHQGIEGITDPTGRILGKMAHSERGSLYKNIPGNFNQKIFTSGVKYFA